MKIQLSAKETRKLATARGLIKSVVEKLPFSSIALESAKSVDNQFTVNADGSSEFEIHEKSFTAFLEYGSEMFVTVGDVLKTAGAGISAAFKEFDESLTDVKETLLKHDKGFLTKTEIDLEIAEAQAKMNAELAAAREERDKLSAFSPAQVKILKQMLTEDNFEALLKSLKPRIEDSVSTPSVEESLKEFFGPVDAAKLKAFAEVHIVPVDQVPEDIRIKAARTFFKAGAKSLEEICAQFNVTAEQVLPELPPA